MIARLLSTAPLALCVTCGLLYLMHALIVSGETAVTEPIRTTGLALAKVRKDRPAEVIDDPVTIDPPVETPPTVAPQPGPDDFGPGLVPMFVSEPAPIGGPTDFGPVITDGPLVALVRVAPEYPVPLASRGVEGFATVEFDVTEAGTVTNVRVIDASHAAFGKPAVRAAERFKYRPRVVDGVAIATRGVQYRFRFVLEKA